MITYIDLFLLESYYIKIVNYKTDKRYGKINDKKEEDVKQLILYTIFGNMTFVISIVSYAFLDIYMGMNELSQMP